jgi:alkylated DNA repair dioxygenase AlkB
MGRHGAQPKLFDVGGELPNGFIYRPDFLTPAEEDVLIAMIENIDLEHPIYEGKYEAKRRIKSFGWSYDFKRKELIPGPPLPKFLQGVQRKIAKWLDIPVRRVAHALVTEYQPNTALGFHVDTEEFEHVVGISLAGWCRMRLKPSDTALRGVARDELSIELEQRSAYIMQGEVRSKWLHAIAPTKTLRYSITFRTLG